MKRLVLLTLLALLNCVAGNGQTSNVVVGSDPFLPVPLVAAPGEVTTIFVQGIGSQLRERVAATSLPLPTILAGISVSLTQRAAPQGPLPVPLFAVFPISACANPGIPSCGRLTAITLQIPFELVAILGPAGGPTVAHLVVSENGRSGDSIEILPVTDHIHVLRRGDTIIGSGAMSLDPSREQPIVTHADGTLVTSANPARPGETLVLYAVGLGLFSRLVKSGEPSPLPSPAGELPITFNFHPNAGPSKPFPGLPVIQGLQTGANRWFQPQTTAFAGLVAGFVGLYQVNFVVPEPPSSLLPCRGEGPRSNLTVSVGGPMSFDGAGICVVPPAAAVNSDSQGKGR